MWLKRMNVAGSSGDTYVVGIKDDKTWGCSCPAWKFHRAPKVDCKHIAAVKAGLKAQRPARPPLTLRPTPEVRTPTGIPLVLLDLELGEVAQTIPSASRFAALEYAITVL